MKFVIAMMQHETNTFSALPTPYEAFNKLIVEARAELNEDKRREMYREMQVILRDEGGVIVPMFANAVVARNEAITHGDDVSAVRPFDGRRIIERWWLA